jgi:heat shock protein HtpX
MALADMVHRMASTMQFAGFVMVILFAGALFEGASAPHLAIVMLLIAPLVTGLIQLALNRTREYDADLDAVGLTGDPEGLASALKILERRQGAMWEHLMLPGGGRMPDPSLLRTHPRTKDRVARLMSLQKPASPPDFGHHDASRPTIARGTVPVVRAPRIHRTGVWY